jgi:hypothetical protein
MIRRTNKEYHWDAAEEYNHRPNEKNSIQAINAHKGKDLHHECCVNATPIKAQLPTRSPHHLWF